MKIAITLSVFEPQKKYLGIEYIVHNPNTPEFVLSFPVWSPGSYLVREYESQLESFTVCDGNGRHLAHEKITKSQWKIKSAQASKIIVKYRIYGSELNVRAAYSDHEMVFCNPTAAFFYPEAAINTPIELKIKLPDGWRAELAANARSGIYEFKNFDQLFDTPILCSGLFEKIDFKARGTNYRMVFLGHHTGDIKKIARDMTKIVTQQIELFGKNPCQNYLFQVIFAAKHYGGLEHSFSSTNIFDGTTLENEKDYNKFLSLLSHEHFHLWNVKRIRPIELGPFDYQRENYTRELWLAEGVTSYYDDHFVWRAGKTSKDDYLALLAENINKFESTPAKLVNSMSESSFDAWIKFYRPGENSLNTVTSYYLKGGLVAMLMDFHILKSTDGKFSLDDVLKALYTNYTKKPEKGITRQEFFEITQKTTGISLEKLFLDFVDGVKPIDWQHEFSPFGIEVTKKNKSTTHYFGVILSEHGERVTVQSIAEDGPAFSSKLQPGDEIIAFNKERITSTKQLDHVLKCKEIHVIFSRRGRLCEDTIKLSKSAKPIFSLSFKKKISPHQQKLQKRFLRK